MKTVETIINRASKLRFQSSTVTDWHAVFPDFSSLDDFYDATKNMTFPGTYGQSPFDDAFSLAYEIRHGLSPSSVDFYSRMIRERDWHGYENHMLVLESYGVQLPGPIAQALQGEVCA